MSVLEKMQARDLSRRLPESAPVKEKPFACPQCSSVAYWLDVYGGGPHCRTCRPPPGRSFVLEAHDASGEPHPSGEPLPSDSGEPVDLDVEFHRQWREYLTGTEKNPRRVIQRRDFKFTETMSK